MPRFSSTPYVWLPPYHWLEGGTSSSCRHQRFDVKSRAATGRSARGEVRYWRTCVSCGLEIGPFMEPDVARRFIWSDSSALMARAHDANR
jgi:hypothetical protein